MLAHRLRRWANLKPSLVQRLVLAGHQLTHRNKVNGSHPTLSTAFPMRSGGLGYAN